MNIGFHYFATKTLAVKAGFSAEEAQLIAYSCQYVDDAVEHKKITIQGLPDPLYERMSKDELDPTCTAHKGVQNVLFNRADIREKILLPFHFIPAGWDTDHSQYNYVTSPEAPKAVELVRHALEKLRSAPAGNSFRQIALIRLGIALHSYEDTFAHQRFSSLNNKSENGVSKVRILSNNRKESIPMFIRIKGLLGFRIGHGLLSTFPDRFMTEIIYLDGRRKQVEINTNKRFELSARKTYNLLREYTGQPDEWEDFVPQLMESLQRNNRTIKDWHNTFSALFPDIEYHYGEKTWLGEAIKRDRRRRGIFAGDMKWLNFHQASYEQRLYMMATIPRDI